VREVHAAKKPIGAICIAPALIAAILGKETGLTVTIGNDAGTAAEIEKPVQNIRIARLPDL